MKSSISVANLESAVGAANAGNISAFRAFRAQTREAFRHYQGPFVSIDLLLSWGTSRFSAQRVHHDTRRQGLSNYTYWKLTSQTMEMMTGFSIWPLRQACVVGFMATPFGLAVPMYVIIRYNPACESVPGFPFLAVIIAIFSAVQLFALGIMGEYLATMHFQAMDRPTSAVWHDTRSGEGRTS